MLFLLASCTALKEKKEEEQKQKEVFRHLQLASELLAKRDFEGSLLENQKVLSLSDKKTPGDEALFNMGLIYAHYRNPGKDYKKSFAFFRRLIKEYPRSPLVEHARIWIGVLRAIEKSKQVDIEIEEMKKELLR
jgi:TolA-binding protein